MRTLAALCLLSASVLSAQDASTSKWKPIEFLFGDWAATGNGGVGEFSFHPEVNQQIVIRKNFAEYKKGEPRHDDFMVIYADAAGQPLRAIYFDSEGHTIHYVVKTPAPNVAIFEADSYKLTYELKGKELQGKFEVGGKVYLTWTSVKK